MSAGRGSRDNPAAEPGEGTFKHELETLEASLRPVLPRMLNYGVHLIVATNRGVELHSGVRYQLVSSPRP